MERAIMMTDRGPKGVAFKVEGYGIGGMMHPNIVTMHCFIPANGAPSNITYRESLPFRDYLRNHQGKAKRYADLKHELASRPLVIYNVPKGYC